MAIGFLKRYFLSANSGGMGEQFYFLEEDYEIEWIYESKEAEERPIF
jgi:hypothetical protein